MGNFEALQVLLHTAGEVPVSWFEALYNAWSQYRHPLDLARGR